MTDREMQKIIEGLKNDPEVGGQVRELLAAQLTARVPETKIEIDPGLVRQAKQYLALQGGGTFTEQLQANLRAGCVALLIFLLIFFVPIALFVLIGLIGAATQH